MVLTFFIHALCAVGYCLPHYQAPGSSVSAMSVQQLRSREEGLSNPPVVQLSNEEGPIGGVQGTLMATIKGRPLAAFMGIPYAEPPVGKLRFIAPKPVSPWEGIRITNQTSPICLQLDAGQYFYVYGREDCLYLNVYTPKLPSKSGSQPKLPVIVYIHGGAFLFGGGSDLGPAYFLDQDVILVTFNYRLGILGFLSTGDETCPGNNGLKDQAMALRWVADNIEKFGGDKDRITFMGQSAGATSVNLHLISNQTKNIPFAAIMHSGTAHMEWAVVNNTAKNSKVIAESFRCKTENSQEMINCLRNQNPYFVVHRTFQTFKTFYFPTIAFGPVVEKPGPDAFLTQHPKDAYADGNVRKVPLIAGLVEDEGDLFTFGIVLYPGVLRSLNRKWFNMAPYTLDYYYGNAPNPDDVSRQVRDFYFGNEPISFKTRGAIGKMLGDRLVVTGVHKGLQYHSAIAPTYGYYFTYKGRYSVAHALTLNRNDWGVTHLDDISYFLNSTLYFQPMQLNDPEYIVSEFLLNVWSNFATTGKPYYVNDEGNDEVFWEPISDPFNMKLIEINKEIKAVPFPFKQRIKFWENLYLTDDYKFPENLSINSIYT